MKRRSVRQNGSYIDIYEYQSLVRAKTVDAVPLYVASVYRLLFDTTEVPLVHWFLLHRAVQYQILWLEGRLPTDELRQRRKEALLCDVSAISDLKERAVIQAKVDFSPSPDFSAENKRLSACRKPHYKKPWALGAWAMEQYNWEICDETRPDVIRSPTGGYSFLP